MNGEETTLTPEEEEKKKIKEENRLTYIASYRVGRIWTLGKLARMNKSFHRNIGLKRTGTTIATAGSAALYGLAVGGFIGAGLGFIAGGVAGWFMGSDPSDEGVYNDSSPYRPGYLFSNSFIEGPLRTEFTITEFDHQVDDLIKKNGSTEVGNFIFPWLHSRGFYKDYDIKSGVVLEHILPIVEQEARQESNKNQLDVYPTIKDEKFIIKKGTGHSGHYLEKHCYLQLKGLGDEIAKIGQLKNLGDGNFGGKYTVWFTHCVTWIMHVKWDDLPEIKMACSLKEDLDSSSDLGAVVKFVAQTAITVGAMAVSGGTAAGAAAMVSKVQGPTNLHQRKSQIIADAYDANWENWSKGKPDKLIKMGYEAAEQAKFLRAHVDPKLDEIENEKWAAKQLNDENAQKSRIARAAEQADIAASVNRRKAITSVARSFSGLSRLMSGGSATFTSPVSEFMAHKISDPLLEVTALTSQSGDDAWRAKMNKHIFNWYFPFAGDDEIQMERGFGWDVGVGSEILKDLHGWIQLDEHMELLETMPNDLFSFWTGNAIFVYQFCCGEATKNNGWTHASDCRRPHWKKDNSSFYPGFQAVINQPLVNLPQQNHTFTFNQVNTISTQSQKIKLASHSYCYLWTGGEGDKENYNFVSQGKFVINKLVLSTPIVKEKGIGYGEDCFPTRNPPAWAKGNKYVQLSYEHASPGDKYKFGVGPKYRYLCVGYPESAVNEEIWVDRGVGDGYWEVVKEMTRDGRQYVTIIGVGGGITDVNKTTVNLNLNALNLNISVPVSSINGMESWGANPPDGFGVGGGQGVPAIQTWLSSFANTEPVGGILLPDANLTRHQIPDQVRTSMINMAPYTEKMKLPDPIEIPVIQQVHEQNYVSETQNLNLHDPVGIRGTVSQPTTTTQKPKERERQKQTEN